MKKVIFLIVLSIYSTEPLISQTKRQLFKEANSKIKEKDYSHAIDIYSKIIKKDSLNERAYILRGRCYDTINSDFEAYKDFSKVLKLNNKSVQALIGRGSLLYARDGTNRFRLNEALEDINKAISLKPKNYLCYNLRGDIYLIRFTNKNEEIKAALKEYELALKLKPGKLETINRIGTYYNRISDYKNALKFYNQSLEKNPLQPAIYYSRAWVRKYQNKDTSGAIEDYSCTIELNPNSSYSYHYRGEIYLQKHDFKKALDDFNSAINLDSNNYDAIFLRGYTNLELDRFQLSFNDFSKIINTALKAKTEKSSSMADSYFGQSLYFRGFANYYSEDYEEACIDWEEALDSGYKRAIEPVATYCSVRTALAQND